MKEGLDLGLLGGAGVIGLVAILSILLLLKLGAKNRLKKPDNTVVNEADTLQTFESGSIESGLSETPKPVESVQANDQPEKPNSEIDFSKFIDN